MPLHSGIFVVFKVLQVDSRRGDPVPLLVYLQGKQLANQFN